MLRYRLYLVVPSEPQLSDDGRNLLAQAEYEKKETNYKKLRFQVFFLSVFLSLRNNRMRNTEKLEILIHVSIVFIRNE